MPVKTAKNTKKEKVKTPEQIFRQKKQRILSEFVERHIKPNKLNWARDVKIIYRYFDKYYPDIDFWLQLRFDKQFDNMLFIESQYWSGVFHKKYKEYVAGKLGGEFLSSQPNKQPLELTRTKIGDDLELKKPQTLKEFLKDA